MEKASAINRVNAYLGYALLNDGNTLFSNVNAAKPVWWFNIDPRKFKNELHLLCARNAGLIWLTIEANRFPNLEKAFRRRPDNGKIDFETSCGTDQYMHDVKNGGSGYDFRPHVQQEWP